MEELGQTRGQGGGPSVNLGPADLGQGEDARLGTGQRLGAQGGGVQASSVVVQRRLQAGARVRVVHISATRDDQTIAQLGAHPQHAGAVGTAQPLLARARVGGTAQSAKLDRYRADPLGSIEQHGNIQLGQGRGSEAAAEPAHVRTGDQGCVGGHPVGQLAQRYGANGDAEMVARGLQRPHEAGMLLVAGEDLLASGQPQPGDDRAHSLAGAGRERDIARVGSQGLRVERAQPVAQLAPALKMRLPAAVALLAVELLVGGGHRAVGQRPVGPRVQVGEAIEDRILRA